MRVLTAAEMREVDRLTTERYGIPSLQLMEAAGRQVAECVAAAAGSLSRRRIVILCGKGNNGGDGLVAARCLKAMGASPLVLLFSAPERLRGDASTNLARWREAGGEVRTVTSTADWEAARSTLHAADVLLDALLGTGLDGPAEGELAAAIEEVNRAAGKKLVVSVDIPSGMASDEFQPGWPSIRADYTVTLAAPKLGLLHPGNANQVGRLLVRDIGTPYELLAADAAARLVWVEYREFASLQLRRRVTSHKGDFGHALLIAGSRGKTGAAILGAMGALRIGAGLVTVATPLEVLPIVAAGLPELMTEPLLGTDAGSIAAANLDYGHLERLAEGKHVVAVGPGLSADAETGQVVRAIATRLNQPLILDADGLNAFAGRAGELAGRTGGSLALTPHPGEMARLLRSTSQEVQSRRFEMACEAAQAWKAHVVLKGHQTLIVTPGGRIYVNSTGNPGMATGGAGDVLTGILAGLTAQFGTAEWDRILALGVFIHGLAGDLAAAQIGEAPLIASDIVARLPQAWRMLLEECGYA
jgi:NAD(P)H-hydrate epimerase